MEVVAALDLIGEIDRIDLVAEAVAAVMGPSGEATIYAPIGSTPIPAGTPHAANAVNAATADQRDAAVFRIAERPAAVRRDAVDSGSHADVHDAAGRRDGVR